MNPKYWKHRRSGFIFHSDLPVDWHYCLRYCQTYSLTSIPYTMQMPSMDSTLNWQMCWATIPICLPTISRIYIRASCQVWPLCTKPYSLPTAFDHLSSLLSVLHYCFFSAWRKYARNGSWEHWLCSVWWICGKWTNDTSTMKCLFQRRYVKNLYRSRLPLTISYRTRHSTSVCSIWQATPSTKTRQVSTWRVSVDTMLLSCAVIRSSLTNISKRRFKVSQQLSTRHRVIWPK